MKMINIAVLIPTYNEAQNIPALLSAMRDMSAKLSDISFALYVIDDSSPDGTAEVVEKLNTQLEIANFCAKVIRRAQKEGLGRAYIDGFKQMLALNPQPDFVLQMDADLSHNPEYILEYVKAVREGADFIVGTRYINGGSCPDWSWYRKLLSRGGNTYARLVLGRKITDYTGGFNMYSLDVLKKIRWDALDSAGYGFLIDLKYQAQRLSKKIIEIPIQFLDRQHGQSKMPLNTIFQNFALVLRIKMKHLLEK
jgi:dolichol-phosphate mannosyltransferase